MRTKWGWQALLPWGDHHFKEGVYSAARAVRFRSPKHGWFATGINVPEAGRIHWGPFGKVRAVIDCVRLVRKANRDRPSWVN
jgi:hypothetical protein